MLVVPVVALAHLAVQHLAAPGVVLAMPTYLKTRYFVSVVHTNRAVVYFLKNTNQIYQDC